MTVNLIENSYGKDYLKMDPDYFEAFKSSKKENYERIYGNSKLERVYNEQIHPMFEEVYRKLLRDMRRHEKSSVIYTHHINYIRGLTRYYSNLAYEECRAEDIVVDYMASMTDDYFVDLYHYLFPRGKYRVDYIGYFDRAEDGRTKE